MKGLEKLTYPRLAEALVQTGCVPPERIHALLNESNETEQPLPELLVREELFSEWELVRLVSDHFALPVLYPLQYDVDGKLIQALDSEFLRETNLLPVGRFGDVLTVVMPILTPFSVLQRLERDHDVEIFPMTGPISENTQVLLDQGARDNRGKGESIFEGSWSKLFDEAEANIQEAMGDGDAIGGDDPLSFLEEDA